MLDNFLANDNEHLPKLTPLLEADELRLATLSDPESLIRGALAALEKQKSLKRCRHLIDAWITQRLQTLEYLSNTKCNSLVTLFFSLFVNKNRKQKFYGKNG